MELRVRTPSGVADVRVEGAWHDATAADLESALQALSGGSGAGLTLDGRSLPAAEPVAALGLRRGAEVALGGPEPRGWPEHPSLDPVPSPWAGADGAVTGGTVTFDRSPPAVAPAGPQPLVPPVPAVPAAPPAAAPGLAGVAPLVAAGAMVAVTGDLRFAVVVAVTPVLALLAAVARRWRSARAARATSRQWVAAVARFHDELAAACRRELHRRQHRSPGTAELARWPATRCARLWERTPGPGSGLLELRVGTAHVPWDPPIAAGPPGADPAAGIGAALEGPCVLPGSPVVASLGGGGVIGIAGPHDHAVALARSLVCQAAVLHGPAHLAIAVCASPGTVADWDWAKWLPHTIGPGGARLTAASPDAAAGVLAELAPAHPGGGVLLVVDDESLVRGRDAPARGILRGAPGPVAGVVVAASVDRLPSSCTHVLDITPEGAALDVAAPGHWVDATPVEGTRVEGTRVEGIRPERTSAGEALRCALDLAPLHDPESGGPVGRLPDGARLLSLLGLEGPTPEEVTRRWATRRGRLAVPIGAGARGPVVLDLVADGPHGLVAGTTGSGKSELLRSLVTGLAASADPDHLNVVLVDFKGGSAFDPCARLPHVVGLVTDLDQHGAGRAVRCLEAELRRRERVLRAAGAADLAAYLAAGTPAGPLPRLLVVVDEFATLQAALPAFVGALVGIAQRGRSLGMHLLLATQRPAGAVSEQIRANAGFAVSLRVASPADSIDVVGTADAAAIPRHLPGRALLAVGPGEPAPVQVALVSGAPSGAGAAALVAHPFRFDEAIDGSRAEPVRVPARGDGQASDLASIVAAVRGAFEASDRPAPWRPWPDPLPPVLDLEDLLRSTRGSGELPEEVVVGLTDDPDRQQVRPSGWRPAAGTLLLHGVAGAGTTTTIASVALVLAASCTPATCHVYVLDLGAGDLAALAGLPHCGAVVRAGDADRQRRLVRRLREQLDRRLAATGGPLPPRPAIVLLVDGYPAFAAAAPDDVVDDLHHVLRRGPQAGIHAVVTGDRTASIPGTISALATQRWLFRLADAGDHAAAGVPARDVPQLPPGRAVDAGTGLLLQVARPAAGITATVATIAARWASVPGGPAPIGVLPDRIPLAELAADRSVGEGSWTIPVGRRDHDLGLATVEVRPGEHVLVAGPARAGRSTALATLAAAAGAPVVVVAGQRSPVPGLLPEATCVRPHDAAEAVDRAVALAAARGRCLLLVDDADALADSGALEAVVGDGPPGLVVIAAGRPEALRAGYAHWTRAVRRSRLGILLRPAAELDGELLGVQLPRRAPLPMVAGRGYLVQDGAAELVQVAAP